MDLARYFEALTGYTPLRWQERLFDKLARGTIPSAVDLPTGLGKSSVIPIWLIALALADGIFVPRRLAYIVNRRTVVDQATDVVERMRERLRSPDCMLWKQHAATLDDLARRLRALSASRGEDIPLGVSTLRGELADNEEWKVDPARPAIIVGTIDMIGSKLLFSGYGDGKYNRVQHAGLIGQDALIVHDEAHLSPAFSDLLRGIADEQERTGESRRVQVMELSATQRGKNADALSLQAEDESDERTGRVVTQRLDATKLLCLHNHDDLIAGIVELAKLYIQTNSKVLIYVRFPEDAQKIAGTIRKELGNAADKRMALLTGTIRGYERDQLVAENPVYRALLDHQAIAQQSVFLISTSAGEVGIDLDADHVICDLTTLDSMIQRLGRVNRRGGEGREARVDLVWTKNDAKAGEKASAMDEAIAATLTILLRWYRERTDGVLVSPRNLRTLLDGLGEQERETAFSPKPTTPPLTDILLDNWSLTSIDAMPGRPKVAAHLHGLTNDLPETYVAWRREVATLAAADSDISTVGEWFSSCRIETRERLRDRTGRVKKALDALLKNHRKKDPQRDFPVVLLNERGIAEWARLSDVSADESKLRYRTVVLPAEAGGLEHGMLDARAIEPIGAIDIADAIRGVRRERWLYVASASGERFARIATGETAAALPAGLREEERIILKDRPEGAEDEGETCEMILLIEPGETALENLETAKFQQTLDDHTEQIVAHAERISKTLALPGDVREALIHAARWHDRGKDRPVWQRFARNQNGAGPLAKSKKYLHGRSLGGYRHEFGSLLEAATHPDVASLDESTRDLMLHLIAVHHGWARPHFELRAFDHEGPLALDPPRSPRRPPTSAENEAALIETMQRFGRLQQRFGRWGLAWLESLLRCADSAASKAVPSSSPVGDCALASAAEEA